MFFVLFSVLRLIKFYATSKIVQLVLTLDRSTEISNLLFNSLYNRGRYKIKMMIILYTRVGYQTECMLVFGFATCYKEI